MAAAKFHFVLVTKLSELPEGSIDRSQAHGRTLWRPSASSAINVLNIDRYQAAVQNTGDCMLEILAAVQREPDLQQQRTKG
jgi:hypothetical protein